MLIVVAQLLVAYLIELFGMFGVEKAAWDWRKAVGMALAIAGIVVFKWEPGSDGETDAGERILYPCGYPTIR